MPLAVGLPRPAWDGMQAPFVIVINSEAAETYQSNPVHSLASLSVWSLRTSSRYRAHSEKPAVPGRMPRWPQYR